MDIRYSGAHTVSPGHHNANAAHHHHAAGFASHAWHGHAVPASLSSHPSPQRTTVKVFVLGDVDAYYEVPVARIQHAPAKLLPFESLVLCPTFDPEIPSLNECPLGTHCRHVHASVANLTRIEIHVNYAWRDIDEVIYARHPAGTTVYVAPPNGSVAIDAIDTGFLLRTRALQSSRRPLSHCAHYYFNRQCNLGAECRFVHAIFIDPSATALRRAPAPLQLGRSDSSGALADQDACDAELVDAPNATPYAPRSDSPGSDDGRAMHAVASAGEFHASGPLSAENSPSQYGRTPDLVRMPPAERPISMAAAAFAAALMTPALPAAAMTPPPPSVMVGSPQAIAYLPQRPRAQRAGVTPLSPSITGAHPGEGEPQSATASEKMTPSRWSHHPYSARPLEAAMTPLRG